LRRKQKELERYGTTPSGNLPAPDQVYSAEASDLNETPRTIDASRISSSKSVVIGDKAARSAFRIPIVAPSSRRQEVPMNLKPLIKSLEQSDRAKAQIARAGRTPTGLLWSKKEEATVRALYPDYDALVIALKNRTRISIRTRAKLLGISKRQYPWTAAEICRLRRLYPKKTGTELQILFAGVRAAQLRQMANLRGITKDRRPFAPTGIAVIDAIRRRAFELNLTMIDIDEMARTGTYFRDCRWRFVGVRLVQICRAVEALDGDVMAIWR
jgi:hypothetical protein